MGIIQAVNEIAIDDFKRLDDRFSGEVYRELNLIPRFCYLYPQAFNECLQCKWFEYARLN